MQALLNNLTEKCRSKVYGIFVCFGSFATRVSLPFILVLSGLTLVGCVTTTNSTAQVNEAKALESHIQLGLSYLAQKNRDSARLHFTKALELDDDSPGAHNGIALLYQLEREWELAETHFLRALEEDRDFTLARYNYGAFLYSKKRYKEAFEAFKKVSQDLVYDGRPMALANMGRAALKLNDKERALSAFEHALSLDPKLTLVLIELAEMSFEKKEYAKAKDYLDRYTAIVPRRTARSLWLGIRIERIFGNKDKEASYALALKNLHPYSKQYLEYQKSLTRK